MNLLFKMAPFIWVGTFAARSYTDLYDWRPYAEILGFVLAMIMRDLAVREEQCH